MQLKQGTAWLNTKQMAELFSVGTPAINHHIREIIRDGELAQDKCKQLLQQPGQDRSTNHYSLDMILAALGCKSGQNLARQPNIRDMFT